jgi:hypothetical protein
MRIRWIREKASSWPVSLAPRRVDSSAVSAIRFSRGSSTREAISSSPPMIGVSRLLKSWAMPPVSWPTASIFCAWRSASSALSALADLGLEPVERGAEVGGALADPALERLVALRRVDSACQLGDVVGDSDEADMLAPGPQRGCETERSQRHSPSPLR